MNIENSFKFSGSTSCPGGWDPEKSLRYPLNMSTVFSVMLPRISLSDLSSILEAAALVRMHISHQSDGKHTLFGNSINHSVLVNELHSFHAALIYRGDHVDTPDSSLAISGSIQQRRLEMRIQLGVKLAVIAEKNTKCLIRIERANFQVRAKRMLQEVPVIGRYLETVRAADLQQCLIARFALDRVRNLLRQLQTISRCMEVTVEESLSPGNSGDVS